VFKIAKDQTMDDEDNVVPVASWDRCIPHYADPPIYMKCVRSMLAVGSFVSLIDVDEFEVETRTIYRLVSYKATTVELNEFAPFARCNLSRAPITEGWGRYLNEVVMTSSLESFESATLRIEVAFVMSEEELQSREFQRADGVDILKVVRYRDDNKPLGKSFFGFPDWSPDYPLMEASYSLVVFDGLSRIADKAGELLTREAVSQGEFPSVRGEVATDPRTISFIKAFCKVDCQKRIDVTTRHKRTLAGVETEFFQRRRQCEYFRWDTDAELGALTKLFGPTSIVGNRIRQPNGTYKAKPGRTMNVVVCANHQAEEFKRRTRRRGFDIMTDGEICRLFIRCQRHKMGDAIPSPRLRSTLEYNVIQREESSTPCLVNVGNLFLEEGRVQEIAEFEGRFAVIPFGDKNLARARFIPLDELIEIHSKIEDYNS
jgi:hypothetical protein